MEPMTELDLPALLDETGALLEGHFRLSSGLHSSQYVQCARLLMDPQHAHRLGGALAARLQRYRPELIVAPALGGLIIGFTTADALGVPMIFTERKEGAMTLRRGFQIEPGARVAVIEDVVTTGKSTRETDTVVREHGGGIVAHGAIMNRSGKDNPFDEPFEFLHQLELLCWTEEECRLCREGVPLDSPGSRFGGAV
jgi:orotate phosphoribosyltransferase